MYVFELVKVELVYMYVENWIIIVIRNLILNLISIQAYYNSRDKLSRFLCDEKDSVIQVIMIMYIKLLGSTKDQFLHFFIL